MTQISFRLVAILLLVSLATSATLMTYDPVTGATSNSQFKKDDFLYRYFYKRTISVSSFSFESVRYNALAASGNKDVITFATTVDNAIKAVSKGYTCAMLYDATSSAQKLNLAKFVSTTNELVEELIATTRITAGDAANVATVLDVADSCSAIRINGNIYHFDTTVAAAAPKFATADILPSPIWANPSLSEDFNIVVGDAAIYKYTAGTKTYASALAATFFTNKKVWSTGNKLLIASWVDTATTNIKNFSVKAYVANAATYDVVGSIEGQYYDTVSNNPPIFSISSTLQTVAVYGKTNATGFFGKLKTFDYTAKTQVELIIPAWMTATQSSLLVSDAYLYARNIADKTGATAGTKQHGGYYIVGAQLVPYFDPINLVAGETTDWVKSLIYPTRSGELFVLRQHVAANVITIQDQLNSPMGQIVSFDKKFTTLTATVTGAGTTYYEKSGQSRFFQGTVISATLNSFAAVFNDNTSPTFTQITATLAGVPINQNFVVKAVSANFKCALFYDGTNTALKTYNFDIASTGVATLVDTVTPALYTGITLTDAGTTFDVSDNCKGIRINNVIIHKHTDNTLYADTLPTGVTTLTNPAFSADFSMLFTDAAIYYYTAKGAANGIYTLDRNDTFYQTKRVEKAGNNYLVYSQKVTNTTLRDWKLQFYTVASSASTKIGQFTGITAGDPTVLVSPRLSKVIIKGTSATNASLTVYVGKTIDWPNAGIKDISLPTEVTSINTDLALSDQFLYVRNSYTNKRHSAYIVMGGTLIQAFEQAYPFPTTDLQRTVILPDQTFPPRLILGDQYVTGDIIRVVSYPKKSIPQTLNPGRVAPEEMALDKAGSASFKRQAFPNFGKWAFTTSTGTSLNYVEYDNTQTNNKKTITKAMTGNNVIIGTSPSFDCVITFVAATPLLSVYQVNSTASTIANAIDVTSLVTTSDRTAAQVTTASSGGTIQVGNGCWAFKIDNFVYLKNAGGTAFTKLTIGSGLTSAVFDSTLNFAYAANKIYKFTTTDYAEIVTGVTGLFTSLQLYSNTDLTRLVLLSFQAATGSTFSSQVKPYYLVNSTWTAVTIPSTIGAFTTLENRPYGIFSPSLDTIGVYYTGGTAAAKQLVAYVAKADTTGLTLYTNPPSFLSLGPNFMLSFTFWINDNFLHVLRNTNAGVRYSEFIYKLDKVNVKLVQIARRQLKAAENDITRNRNIFESSGNTFIIYEIQPAGINKVFLLKRLIGGSPIQNNARGIETRQSGLLVQNGQLLNCLPGCKFCVNPTTCQECMTGFVMDSNNYCLRCGPLCASCTQADPTTCAPCLPGFYLDAAPSCVKCDSNCLTCTAAGPSACTSCKVGFYLIGTVCASCIDNCVSCAATTSCDVCRLGFVYHPTLNTCVKCIGGCTNCKYDKIYECEKCAFGFEPVINNNTITSCKPCPINCQTCSAGVCLECRQSFRLVNNTCIPPCRLPCKDCSSDPSVCTSCIGGFALNGQTCNPDLSCNTNKTCTFCPIGFNLVRGFCYRCNAGANCRTCDIMNIEKCTTCVKGFFLSSTGICKACNVTGCFACDSDSTCSECKQGFTLSGDTTTSSRCLKCDDSCATCFQSPVNCETCATGYTRVGWACVNNNNIKLSLKLGGNFSTFTTANYKDIEQAICDAVGKDRNQITINDMRSGSIIIDATMNVDNINQQSTLVSALQAALATNAQLAGFSIETSSVSATIGDVNYLKSLGIATDEDVTKYKNIAIIVGVVIPVGLIILFIIFFILYKKGVICADSGATKIRDGSMNELNVQNKESELGTMRH